MQRRLIQVKSQHLNRVTEVLAFGHAGQPVLLFPTAGGNHTEAEDRDLIRSIRWLIEDGRVRVYCCGSVADEGWLSPGCPPAQKALLQTRFDRYLAEELVPWIFEDTGSRDRLFATGASLGAYNAVNVHARHPDLFRLTIAMSGTFDFDRWMQGHRDLDYYLNQPLQFVPNLGAGKQLELLRQGYFHIVTGRGRWEAPWESVRLGQALGGKQIPNYVDLWGTEVDHDWPSWRTMLPVFLDRFVG